MKYFHLFISLAAVLMLIWLNRTFGSDAAVMYGGLTWVGWVSIALVGIGVGFLS